MIAGALKHFEYTSNNIFKNKAPTNYSSITSFITLATFNYFLFIMCYMFSSSVFSSWVSVSLSFFFIFSPQVQYGSLLHLV